MNEDLKACPFCGATELLQRTANAIVSTDDIPFHGAGDGANRGNYVIEIDQLLDSDGGQS